MQAPTISIPLKQTSEIDWIQPLKSHIRKFYSEDPERFTEQCAILQRLRQDIRGAGKDSESSRNLLYRYCGQLEFLDRRFSVDEKNVKVSFTWFDAFTQSPISQYSLAYEKASVIFNIGAILSCNAAARNRSVDDELKKVWHEFQLAAGMLSYLNDNFQYAPSTDLNRSTVSTLELIMLAQAQEAFLERQVQRKTKDLMIAKLASHAASLWFRASEGVQENVTKGVFDKSWLILAQCKAAHLASLAQFYQSSADVSGAKSRIPNYGQQITRLQLALKQATDAKAMAKSFPKTVPESSQLGSDTGPALVSWTEKHLDTVKEKLEEAKRDNDTIYHQPIPSEAQLSAVEVLVSANPSRIGKDEIDEIIGPDIFADLVPSWVTTSDSLYTHKRDTILREVKIMSEGASKDKKDVLDELDSWNCINMLKGGSSKETLTFKEFKELCEDISAHRAIDEELAYLDKEHRSAGPLPRRFLDQLDEDQRACDKLYRQYGAQWTQSPSSPQADSLREEIAQFSQAVGDAKRLGDEISDLFRQHQSEFTDMRRAGTELQTDGNPRVAKQIFRQALDARWSEIGRQNGTDLLNSSEFSLIDGHSDERESAVARIEATLHDCTGNMNRFESHMSLVYSKLQEKAKRDDIRQYLLEHLPNKQPITNEEDPIFEPPLMVFEKLRSEVGPWKARHSDELDLLQTSWTEFAREKSVSHVILQFNGIKELKASNQQAKKDFEVLQSKLRNTRLAYQNMLNVADSLAKNIDSFIGSREGERKELLRRLTAEAPQEKVQSSAQYDQTRLNELMGRMNVAPKPPPSRYDRPAPLQNLPPSHQHYNPAKSPPLSSPYAYQQNMAQPPYGSHMDQKRYPQHPVNPPSNGFGYDPTHYGPVSPPPNQQHFSQVHPSHAGYQTPPPPHANRASLPAGYVPPPPPGPPPPNAGRPQRDNDPYGGLNDWR